MNKNTLYLATASLVLTVILLFQETAVAQKYKKEVIQNLDNKQKEYGQTAQQIWQWAEVGYQAAKSSALLQELLRKEGFTNAVFTRMVWKH